jgi:hypothetical protein
VRALDGTVDETQEGDRHALQAPERPEHAVELRAEHVELGERAERGDDLAKLGHHRRHDAGGEEILEPLEQVQIDGYEALVPVLERRVGEAGDGHAEARATQRDDRLGARLAHRRRRRRRHDAALGEHRRPRERAARAQPHQ